MHPKFDKKNEKFGTAVPLRAERDVSDRGCWLRDCLCTAWSRHFYLTLNLKLGCPVTTFILQFHYN